MTSGTNGEMEACSHKWEDKNVEGLKKKKGAFEVELEELDSIREMQLRECEASRKLSGLEKKIQYAEIEKQPEIVKLKEEISRLAVKIKNTSKELKKKKEDKENHAEEVEKLQNDLVDLTKQLYDLREKGQDAGEKRQLADGQLETYHRIKEDAGMQTTKLRDEKEVLDRKHHADIEARKNLEENLQQLGSRKEELQSQEKQMQTRLKNIIDPVEKHKELTRV